MRICWLKAGFILFCVSGAAGSDVGNRFAPEKKVYKDAVTGLTITALTTAPSNDQKPYQTHPHWTSDGQYILFRSNRNSEGRRQQAFLIHESSGEIIQLTEGPTGAGSLNLARKSNHLYFFRGGWGEVRQLIELALDPLLADSKAGTLKDPGVYERVIMTLPEDLRESGGFALDANEQVAYVGVQRRERRHASRVNGGAGLSASPHEETGMSQDNRAARSRPTRNRSRSWQPGNPVPVVPCGIRSIDLQTGEIKTVIDVDFQMGHVQTNPWVPGEIIYCHETGGDAPQRMWITRSDGTGNRPLYEETAQEWVTHEVCVDADHVLFNIMGHLPRLRTKPTGIALIHLRTNEMRLLGQCEGQGFWHCQGSPDGRWAVGDTFDGSIYVINRKTGEQTLLTTDHKMKPDHTHPVFSPDSKRILIQSGHLSDGKHLDLMTVDIPEALMNPKT